ncbi:MAG TPA: aldo/keto reductase, partial [Acidimicrobiales bacterium]|nr:aldo/keto reductase [Acidimicrobiales bacterium]
MQYTHLGRSGLSVSRLCLGTMNFGPLADQPTAFALMDRAHEAGVNFFDSADVYGPGVSGTVLSSPYSAGRGVTEEIVGNWFAQGGGRRERTVMATKVFGYMGPWPNESKLSALHIKRACEASLGRLRTDYIDLYQMHHIDRATPWEEIWEAMETLRYQGKVLYVGSSNFAGWHIAKAQEAAERRHFLGLVSEQDMYNLLVRDVERDVLPACADYGLGFISWSPLYGGALAGMARKADEGSRRNVDDWVEGLDERRRDRVVHYEDLCHHLGALPATVALAWLLTRPGVTAPIIGPRTAEQLETALAALELELDEEVLGRLEELFPGHKTSPEDY